MSKRFFWSGFSGADRILAGFVLLILALVLVLALSGCAPKAGDIFLSPGQKARTAVSPHRVVVYDKLADVPGEFEEIGLISVKGSAMWTRRASMIQELQEKASGYGANAIYIHTGKDIGVLGKVLTTYYTLGLVGKKSLQAVMIYIHPEQKEKAGPEGTDIVPGRVEKGPQIAS